MKVIHTSGKRKTAIARATLKQGSGKIRINNELLDSFSNQMTKLKIQEPLILSEDKANKVNINVKVMGGGLISQAEAARLAIARAMSKFDKKLEKVFLDYDRHLLVADVRRKETHKPNRHGKSRGKKQKSYR